MNEGMNGPWPVAVLGLGVWGLDHARQHQQTQHKHKMKHKENKLRILAHFVLQKQKETHNHGFALFIVVIVVVEGRTCCLRMKVRMRTVSTQVSASQYMVIKAGTRLPFACSSRCTSNARTWER